MCCVSCSIVVQCTVIVCGDRMPAVGTHDITLPSTANRVVLDNASYLREKTFVHYNLSTILQNFSEPTTTSVCNTDSCALASIYSLFYSGCTSCQREYVHGIYEHEIYALSLQNVQEFISISGN